MSRSGQQPNIISADGFGPPRIPTPEHNRRSHTCSDTIRGIWEAQATAGTTARFSSTVEHRTTSGKAATAATLLVPSPDVTTTTATADSDNNNTTGSGRGGEGDRRRQGRARDEQHEQTRDFIEAAARIRDSRSSREDSPEVATVAGPGGATPAGGGGNDSGGTGPGMGLRGRLAVRRATSRLLGKEFEGFTGVR